MQPLDIDQAYRRYAPQVYRRAVQLVGEARAWDAVQETFLLLTRNRETLDPTHLAALLNRMTTNVCLNQLRKKASEGVADDSLLTEIACSRNLELHTAARRMLGRLFGSGPDSTRTMAVLHFVDGLTLEEVAQETELSVSGVRKRLRKLKASLKALEEVPS